LEKEKVIRTLVKTAVESYANGFETRHISEKYNPDGVINVKINNVFIAALGEEIQYYSALVRSLDSSLGNMLEGLAVNIAQLFYSVNKEVVGFLHYEQIRIIADILEEYKSHSKQPSVCDYQTLRAKNFAQGSHKRHDSDYYLIDNETQTHYLIELKIGGDLDNKKSRSEKEALLEQFAILSNSLSPEAEIKMFFATAYNRYGEGKPWNQGRVKQFFADDELLIGKDFWNFICKSNDGYNIVLEGIMGSFYKPTVCEAILQKAILSCFHRRFTSKKVA